MFYDFRGEGTPIVTYEEVDGCYPVYYRVCPKCGRFVKPDEKTRIPEYQGKEPNATCKRCGRVQMEFCTWNPVLEEGELEYMNHLDVYC